MKKIGIILSVLLGITTQDTMAQLTTGAGGAAAVGANSSQTNVSVGIGTNAPSQKLHIKSTTSNDGIKLENSSTGGSVLYLQNTAANGRNWALFSAGSANTNLGGAGNFSIFDMTGNQNRFVIQGSTGNIGIGTNTLSSKLNVAGGISLTVPSSAVVSANLQNTNNEFNLMAGSSAIDGAYVSLRANGNTNRPGSVTFISSGTPDGSQGVEFMNYNAGAWVSNAVLTKDGKLGLGTSTPNAKLDVNGSVRVSDNDIYFRGGTDQNHGLGWYGYGAAGSKSFNGMYVDGPVLYGFGGGVLGVNQVGVMQKGVLSWNAAGKVFVGDVAAIGTLGGNLSPDYSLYVTQGILTEKVKVSLKSASSWADYVFADDYKMKTLSEVEEYVKENKHLPNVPSAEQVAKEGIDMATMDAKLLEKVEELTLYLIEMNKEVKNLKAENSLLQAKLLQK